MQLFVKHVGQQVTEEALKAAVELHVPDISVKAQIPFYKPFETIQSHYTYGSTSYN